METRVALRVLGWCWSYSRLASNSWSVWMETSESFSSDSLFMHSTCFQFVKRMNGNSVGGESHHHQSLASNSWSVWMETWDFPHGNVVGNLASNSWSVWMETQKSSIFAMLAVFLLPIREAYEWKQIGVSFGSGRVARPCFQFVKRMNGNDV